MPRVRVAPFNARFMLPVIGGIVLGLILYLFPLKTEKWEWRMSWSDFRTIQGYISFKSGLLRFCVAY